MAIKKSWVVLGMDGRVLDDMRTGVPGDFSSERSAIKRAKQHVIAACDSEAWVYCITHVVSRPDDAVVDAVK